MEKSPKSSENSLQNLRTSSLFRSGFWETRGYEKMEETDLGNGEGLGGKCVEAISQLVVCRRRELKKKGSGYLLHP